MFYNSHVLHRLTHYSTSSESIIILILRKKQRNGFNGVKTKLPRRKLLAGKSIYIHVTTLCLHLGSFCANGYKMGLITSTFCLDKVARVSVINQMIKYTIIEEYSL